MQYDPTLKTQVARQAKNPKRMQYSLQLCNRNNSAEIPSKMQKHRKS